MTSIMTVLGPVSPDALGATYMHEHVLVDNSFSGNNPLKKLDEVDTLIDEMRDVRRAGGRRDGNAGAHWVAVGTVCR